MELGKDKEGNRLNLFLNTLQHMKNTQHNKWKGKTKLLFLFFISGILYAFVQIPPHTSQKTSVENAENTTFTYRKMGNSAFWEGEKLSFRVHYGLINAATIQMEVHKEGELFSKPEELKGRKAYHISIEGKTIKAFDWAFKVRDRFDSYVDKESLAPLKYSKSVIENNYTDQDLVFFRHLSGKLNGKKGSLDMPAYTQDIVSALYYARNIDYSKAKIGDTFPIHIYLDNKIYNLNFKYAGIETIKSDIGKVKCYKLIPRLVVDRVFKSEEDMTVWITADDNKIPIRVKSDIQVGSLKVDLTAYEGLKNPFTSKIGQ
jgi:hypothetical protein